MGGVEWLTDDWAGEFSSRLTCFRNRIRSRWRRRRGGMRGANSYVKFEKKKKIPWLFRCIMMID